MDAKTRDTINDIIEKAKKAYFKIENYVLGIIKKAIIRIKISALLIKRSRLYYELGKSAYKTPLSEWSSSKAILSKLGDIESIAEEISSIKAKNLNERT